MHGAGNDFIVLDCRHGEPDDIGSLARKLCDRHFGVGADGLLLIGDSDVADASMRIINADGSEAQMCGNGIRCVGKFIYERGICRKNELSVDTLDGVKILQLHIGNDGAVNTVTVDMGCSRIENLKAELTVGSGRFDIAAVSTGNPHCVVFTDDCTAVDIAVCGPQLECHPVWPDKANIEFVTVESRHALRQRTWERGVGQTLACGTGAIAAAVAAVGRGYCDWPVSVRLDGGTLIIDHNLFTGHILMTGSAAEVFAGRIC